MSQPRAAAIYLDITKKEIVAPNLTVPPIGFSVPAESALCPSVVFRQEFTPKNQ